MNWNPSLSPYKNAITNELFIAASVGMYLYFPGDNNTSPFSLEDVQHYGLEPVEPHDTRHLKAAVDGYDWLKNSNMTNKNGLYVDGFHITNWRTNGTKCDDRNEMVYTYNQGVLLSGLRGLWEATGNQSYLDDGHELARNTIRATGWQFAGEKEPEPDKWYGLGRDGILEEQCDAEGRCSQDSQTFKGIFFHHLSLLCEPLPLAPRVPGKTHCAIKHLAFLHHRSCQQYLPWVEHNAKAALNTRDEEGRFGSWWGARNDAEIEPLPNAAVDYRSNVSELLGSQWTGTGWSHSVKVFERAQMLRSMSQGEEYETPDTFISTFNFDSTDFRTKRDFNDRGRGRTLETQGGGVSLLSALWELKNMN